VSELLRDKRLGYGLVIGLYLLVFPWHPGLNSPNELCRLWQARAIVEDGKVEINAQLERYGRVGDLSIKDGRLYPSKAPLISFLGAPIYWVQTKLVGQGNVDTVRQLYWSRLFICVLPTLLMLVLLRRVLLTYLTPEIADPLVVTYALGSLAFAYSEMFFSHQLTAVMLFCAFYCCWKIQRGEWRERAWLLAGALAGLIVDCEYTGALNVVCLSTWVLAARWKQWPQLGRAVAGVVVGAAPFLIALMAYHQACFGHPLESGYKYLNDPSYQHWHLGGFLGIRIPDPAVFLLSFFGPLRGLFGLSPFLMLAGGGMLALRWDRPMRVFVSALILGNAYFTSSFDYTSWGWTAGPRHLTPMVPFLLIPAGLALERLRNAESFDRKIGAGIATGLCVASVVVTGLISLVAYIPDSLSSPLFSLVLPLLRGGYLPPTVTVVFGLPNLGGIAVLCVLAAAAWVGLWLWRAEGSQRTVTVAAVATVVVVLALLAGANREDGGDKGGLQLLQSVWMTPTAPKNG
jgi:hypothetical protein